MKDLVYLKRFHPNVCCHKGMLCKNHRKLFEELFLKKNLLITKYRQRVWRNITKQLFSSV